MAAEPAPPTLADVATRAGVSSATASRVLNRTAPVSEAVRSRVEAAAAALGYRPRALANALTSQGTLALLISSILNPYYPEVVRGIEDEAESDGLALILVNTNDDPQRERRALRMLYERPVDGVIVCGTRFTAQELIDLRERMQMPVVVTNRLVEHPAIPCIMTDTRHGAYRATQYLINLGHRRIGYLAGHNSIEGSSTRLQGIEQALAEAGLSLSPAWQPAGLRNLEGGFQTMSALLALPAGQRPTAVIAFNDLMAVGALQAARAAGVHVPQQLSIVGFDDVILAAHCNPPLTTVDLPKYGLGKLAVQTLRQLRQGNAPPSSYSLLEGRLIVRESTAPWQESV
jgi:LacI family transcriptional regulator